MAVSWRLATALETLRSEVNALYPNRSKRGDGTIGDASHAASASDHNPNRHGVVTGLDLTNDPANGFDAHAMAEAIRRSPHPEAKYIISNSRIAGDFNNWQWQKYSGTNPHSSHVHISVGNGGDGRSEPPYDSTTKWNIQGEDMVTAESCYNLFNGVWMKPPTKEDLDKYVGKYTDAQLLQILMDQPMRKIVVEQWMTGVEASKGDWANRLRRFEEVKDSSLSRQSVVEYIDKNLK